MILQKLFKNWMIFLKIILKKISEPMDNESLQRSFNNMDVDMDGYVSLDDLSKVSDELEEGLTIDELKEIIMSVRGCSSQFDIHTRDVGNITETEFISAIHKSLDS